MWWSMVRQALQWAKSCWEQAWDFRALDSRLQPKSTKAIVSDNLSFSGPPTKYGWESHVVSNPDDVCRAWPSPCCQCGTVSFITLQVIMKNQMSPKKALLNLASIKHLAARHGCTCLAWFHPRAWIGVHLSSLRYCNWRCKLSWRGKSLATWSKIHTMDSLH